MEGVVNGIYPVVKDRRHREKQRKIKRNTRKDDVFSNVMGSNLSWSKVPVLPPHRMIPSGDASYTPYPVHISYPMEPYQFPLYPTIYPVPSSQPLCPVPPARKGRKTERYVPSKKSEDKDSSTLPSQQYASLPPVQCDPFSGKSSDSDSNSKRHYSDPGVGQASSDEESEESFEGLMSPMYLNLLEEIRDLKESLRHVTTELSTAKEEIRELKTTQLCNKISPESSYIPGSLTDVISEIRLAAQAREESLLTTIHAKIDALEANHAKEVSALTDRIDALELKFAKLESRESREVSVGPDPDEKVSKVGVLDVVDCGEVGKPKLDGSPPPEAFSMIRLLQEEKSNLEMELKKAVDDRCQAEADTQKLERLVAILRLKINGLSANACRNEDLQALPVTVTDGSIDLPLIGHVGVIKCNSEIEPGFKSLPRQLKSNNSPPSIPPRPATLATPKRPKTSPPARPDAQIPSTVTDLEKEEENNKKVNENNNSAVVNFSIGKIVSPPCKFVKQGNNSNENSPETLVTSGRTSLGATITVTGPVTDL